MESMAGMTYCVPSNLGKRSLDVLQESLHVNGSIDKPNKLLEYVQSVTSQHDAVGAAWLIHQNSSTEPPALPVDDDKRKDDASATVPLHVACGYIDDMFGVTDLEFKNAINRQAATALSSDGIWPFNEPLNAVNATALANHSTSLNMPGNAITMPGSSAGSNFVPANMPFDNLSNILNADLSAVSTAAPSAAPVFSNALPPFDNSMMWAMGSAQPQQQQQDFCNSSGAYNLLAADFPPSAAPTLTLAIDKADAVTC